MQPHKVLKAVNIARNEGIARTKAKAKGELMIGAATGYSVSGIVLAAGKEIMDLAPGDRVAAAGGTANHAEFVEVPRKLVVGVPEKVDFEEASTVALGSIALQAIRRANPQLGEYVVVFGAGLLGQLTLQMLLANGARTIAVDLEETRLDLAHRMGADLCVNPLNVDPVKEIHHYTGGYGADTVIFCAATNDSRTLSEAFAMTRKKGRLVMVGTWGTQLMRHDIYAKELDFLISTSYGPGRYDSNYEDFGIDYPYEYVRWTENRNMQEYLRLLSTKSIQVKPLIQEIYPISQADQAFMSLRSPSRPLIALLDYGQELPPKDFADLSKAQKKVEVALKCRRVSGRRIRVGIIGAGSFVTNVHLPNLKRLNKHYAIHAICNRRGSSAKAIAQEFGASYATTDYREILSDSEVDLVMICTRHNLHGRMVLDSLQAGKHTFVEKPLCTSKEELEAIKGFFGYDTNDLLSQNLKLDVPLLMVGYNRRFSKYIQEVKKYTSRRINPLFIHFRMNAGYIPMNHWVHTEEGGGRIIGEACHILDLFSFLTETQIKAYSASSFRPNNVSISKSDNKAIIFEYEDGSVANLEYFSVGSRELPKERLEVHFDEKTIIVDDFKRIYAYGINLKAPQKPVANKGHLEELRVLADCIAGRAESWPISLANLVETTQITFSLSAA
jgi:predicted dehydrogenase/threonine dehydrogenase-like Zn-dependent dehydrogenase